MKLNPLVIIGFLSIFTLHVGSAHATSEITGMLFGDEGGVIHPNVNTSVNTFPACAPPAPDDDPLVNPNCYDPGGAYADKFICPTRQYYTDVSSPDYVGDPDPSFVAQIGEVAAGECDGVREKCNLSGFMSSDRFGWISLDGPTLQADLGAVSFPEGHFARLEYGSADTNGFAYLNGFAWSEAGWIQLSACATAENQAECESIPMCDYDLPNSTCNIDPNNFPGVSTATEWGAFIDLNQTPGPSGRPIEGFAWHDTLGWIKWHSDVGDACSFGAWTNWGVDVTPPEVTVTAAEDHFWWKVDNAGGNFTWPQFVHDPDSNFDFGASNLLLQLNAASDFVGCNPGTPTLSNSAVPNHADLDIPLIGNLGGNAFCMYTLTGQIANEDGGIFYITDDPLSLPPDAVYRDPITLYVMPGDYEEARSSIYEFNPGGIKYANGTDEIQLRVEPRDIAGNPLLPIMTDRQVVISGGAVDTEPDSSLWRRDVEMEFDFNGGNPTPYTFDAILPTQTPVNMPVRLHETTPSSTGTLYSAGDLVTFPAGGMGPVRTVAGSYPISAVGYSPTINCGTSCLNDFILYEVNARVVDAEIDAFGLNPAVSAVDTIHTMDENASLISNPLNFSFDFHPPFNVTSAALDTDTISIGQTVEFNYTLENQSSVDLDKILVDHIFDFTNLGVGFGSEVLDIHEINFLSGGSPLDAQTGRSDFVSGSTRYALLSQGAFSNASSNPFHSNLTNHHSPSFDFYSNFALDPSPLNPDGTYFVEGPVYGEVLGNDFLLDRTDIVSSLAPSYLEAGNSVDHTIQMLPIQSIGATFENQVVFSASQLLGYRLEDSIKPPLFDEYAIFEGANQISSIDVQNLGLGASVGSTISGSDIYKALDQQIITLAEEASGGLQTAMRRNVGSLTRNVSPCTVALTTLGTLSTTASSCIIVNDTENTVIAYYEGTVGQLLTLGGSGPIIVPDDYKYTLILKNADLFVTDSIDYGNNSSFGMILLKDDETDQGGNFFLSPEVTNMAGFLYAEGSFLSTPNGSDFYYGNGLNPDDLDNQLYWREGAIATRNTLGGGPNGILPPGKNCDIDGSDRLPCARRFDLNLIRNYATPISGYTGQGVLFSGGGSCDDTLPNCTLGPLSTIITLSGGRIDLNDSILDPFYIQQANRPAPPGFSAGGGFVTDPNVIR